MILDPANLLLGLLLAAAPLTLLLWRQHRQLLEQGATLALQEERLSTAVLAREGLQVQLEQAQTEARQRE